MLRRRGQLRSMHSRSGPGHSHGHCATVIAAKVLFSLWHLHAASLPTLAVPARTFFNCFGCCPLMGFRHHHPPSGLACAPLPAAPHARALPRRPRIAPPPPRTYWLLRVHQIAAFAYAPSGSSEHLQSSPSACLASMCTPLTLPVRLQPLLIPASLQVWHAG